MIRKYIVIHFVLVFLLFSILAGCSGGKAESVSVNLPETQEESSLKPPPELDEYSMESPGGFEENSLAEPPKSALDEKIDKSVVIEDGLEEWLGTYWSEYVMGPNINDGINPYFIYAVKIYKKDQQYYAYFGISGWMSDYLAKATVQGDGNEVLIFYKSDVRDLFLAFSENLLKEGDLLFKLKRTDAGIETEVSELIKDKVHDIAFKEVESEEEYKSIDGPTIFRE